MDNQIRLGTARRQLLKITYNAYKHCCACALTSTCAGIHTNIIVCHNMHIYKLHYVIAVLESSQMQNKELVSHTQKQLEYMHNCVSESIVTHTHARTALGQGDSGSSEPAVTYPVQVLRKTVVNGHDWWSNQTVTAAIRYRGKEGWGSVCLCVCVVEGSRWGRVCIQEALCMLTVSPNWEWQSQ